MRILRRLGGAEDGGLLVADPPVPGCDERALPHADLGLARGFLVIVIVMGEPRIGQRPSIPHHPFLDVLAVDLASRDHPAAAIRGLAQMAGPALVVGMLDEFVARGDAAGPALAAMVEAKLIHRRRVDAAEPNPGAADLDVVALADFRDPDDVGGLRHGWPQHGQDREQQFQEHVKAARSKWNRSTMAAYCGVDWARAPAPGGVGAFNFVREAANKPRVSSSSPANAGDPVFQRHR